MFATSCTTTKKKTIIDLPRSEENKTWTPTFMPPLPPSTAGLSRQSTCFIN